MCSVCVWTILTRTWYLLSHTRSVCELFWWGFVTTWYLLSWVRPVCGLFWRGFVTAWYLLSHVLGLCVDYSDGVLWLLDIYCHMCYCVWTILTRFRDCLISFVTCVRSVCGLICRGFVTAWYLFSHVLGLCVDYSAHIAHAFLHAKGTRDAKVTSRVDPDPTFDLNGSGSGISILSYFDTIQTPQQLFGLTFPLV